MNRLELALWEADRHASALASALAEWKAVPPQNLQEVEEDTAKRRLADQLLFRFLKLQDSLGERLVPATLEALLEPESGRQAMLDKLNRLDALGYLRVDDWLQWRDIRNRLSHEYPEEPDIRWATLKAAVSAAGDMLSAYRAWRQRLPH